MISRTELEEERDFLLRSLEDLDREREAGDVAEDDYLELRDSYTARTAAVLRSLATPPDPAEPLATKRRRLRPVLTAVGVLAVAGVAGALMAGAAGERLPGDPASGSIAATGPSSDLQRARQLVGENKTLEAIKAYDEILRRNPLEPEALAYRGWLLRLAGRAAGKPELIDKAMSFLDRAVAADPEYPDAHFFRGVILYQDRGDPISAVPELRAFLANDPPAGMIPLVEDLLRRALADAAKAEPPADAPAG